MSKVGLYWKTTDKRGSAGVKMNRKRQILDHLINDLFDQYWEMIELAVESSDMQESKDVIDYIRGKYLNKSTIS